MDADNHWQTLVLVDEIGIVSDSHEVRTFLELDELDSYITHNDQQFDILYIYIPGRYICQLNQYCFHSFAQVKRITFFFDSIDEMEQAKQEFGGTSRNFLFCLKTEVANRIQNNQVSVHSTWKLPDDQKSLRSDIEARRRRVHKKQHDLNFVRFNEKNFGEIDSQYLCLYCSHIIRDPVQLNCGHRVCKSCANMLIQYVFDKHLNSNRLIVLFYRGPSKCPECDELIDMSEVKFFGLSVQFVYISKFLR